MDGASANRARNADAVAVVTAIQAEKASADAVKAEKQRVSEAKKRESERQAKMSPQEKLKQAKLDDVVDAQTLFNEFDGNEIAASEKYSRKTIRVEGEVEVVEKGGALSSDRIMLRGRLGYSVRCSVAGGQVDDLKQLRPGSWVRVEGRCDGKAGSGVVQMSSCVFVTVNR